MLMLNTKEFCSYEILSVIPRSLLCNSVKYKDEQLSKGRMNMNDKMSLEKSVVACFNVLRRYPSRGVEGSRENSLLAYPL